MSSLPSTALSSSSSCQILLLCEVSRLDFSQHFLRLSHQLLNVLVVYLVDDILEDVLHIPYGI